MTTFGRLTRNLPRRSHTRVESGRSPVMTLARDGAQTAAWQYARINVVARSENSSRCGVLISASLASDDQGLLAKAKIEGPEPDSPLPEYTSGTWGPAEAHVMLAQDGGRKWRRP